MKQPTYKRRNFYLHARNGKGKFSPPIQNEKGQLDIDITMREKGQLVQGLTINAGTIGNLNLLTIWDGNELVYSKRTEI